MNSHLSNSGASALFLLRWRAHLDRRVARHLLTFDALLLFAFFARRDRLVDRLVELRAQKFLDLALNGCRR